MVNAGGAASYAESKGCSATYWSGWAATYDQIWNNINAGYYTICNVGGHFVLVDNQTSKSTGQIHIYDSYNPSYAWWNEESRCLLSRYTVKEIHVYKIIGSTINPLISDDKNNVLVGEDITFTYSGLTECSKANFYFEDWDGNIFLTKESTSSRNYTHKFENPGIFRVYSGGLYNGKWYYSSKITVNVFDPKLTCDKTNVDTNEEITFEYSGLSACDSVKICFEKNGTVYYEADNSSSRIHKNYFVNPGEYYVFAKGTKGTYTVKSDKIRILVGHTHVFDQNVAESKFLCSNADCTHPAVYYKSCKCGEKGEEIFISGESLGHNYGNIITEVSATCTADGINAHYECSECHKLFVKDGDNYIEKTAAELKIQATGHEYNQELVADKYLKSSADCTHAAVYYKSCKCGAKGTETFEYGKSLGHLEQSIPAVAPNCSSVGYTAGKKCSRCGAILVKPVEEKKKEHEWGEWKVVKEATDKEEGQERRVCKNNSSHIETRTIPKKTTPNQNPTAPSKTDPTTPEPTNPSGENNIEAGVGTISADGTVLTDPDGVKYYVSEKVKNADLKNKLQIADKTSGGKYKITKIIKKNGKVTGGNVTYMAPYNKNCTKATAGATVILAGVSFKITAINANAFKNCKKLTTFKAGGNVTTIGKNAFNGCSSLKSFTITSKNIKSIGANAFKGTSAKVKYKVPKNKLAKYSKMLLKAGASKKAKITK